MLPTGAWLAICERYTLEYNQLWEEGKKKRKISPFEGFFENKKKPFSALHKSTNRANHTHIHT
jgi:hypothetical protein